MAARCLVCEMPLTAGTPVVRPSARVDAHVGPATLDGVVLEAELACGHRERRGQVS